MQQYLKRALPTLRLTAKFGGMGPILETLARFETLTATQLAEQTGMQRSEVKSYLEKYQAAGVVATEKPARRSMGHPSHFYFRPDVFNELREIISQNRFGGFIAVAERINRVNVLAMDWPWRVSDLIRGWPDHEGVRKPCRTMQILQVFNSEGSPLTQSHLSDILRRLKTFDLVEQENGEYYCTATYYAILTALVGYKSELEKWEN